VQAQALKAIQDGGSLSAECLEKFASKVQGRRYRICLFDTPTVPNRMSLVAMGVARTTLSGWAGRCCRSGTAWVILTTPWKPETLEELYFLNQMSSGLLLSEKDAYIRVAYDGLLGSARAGGWRMQTRPDESYGPKDPCPSNIKT